MASADSRSGDRHKHPPIAYRPPEAVREPLTALAEATRTPVSAIITEALRRYLSIETPAAPSEAAGS
jgi:hypothetical protein